MSDNSDLVVLPNGKTATFHANRGSYLRGYVYKAGRRVYGTRSRAGFGEHYVFAPTGAYASLVAA